VAAADIAAYLERLGDVEALDAAINWYRAGAAPGSALAGNAFNASARPAAVMARSRRRGVVVVCMAGLAVSAH